MGTCWYLLLEKIIEICNKSDIGLYRDDVLSIFRNKNDTQLEKIKKKLQRLFKEYGYLKSKNNSRK